MGYYVQQVPVKFESFVAPVSSYTYIDTQSYPFPLSVTAVPGASGSVTVQISTTPDAAGKTTAATWATWPEGTVTVTTTDVLISPVSAIRVTAATAAGALELNG